MNENVFIAWGGNLALAELVADNLRAAGCRPIVGGGQPHSLFVGNQVIEQINRCTQAILLVQQKDAYEKFSDNLMFEWGYLIAKLPPEKIHVFLIGIRAGELPSDIAGCWTKSLRLENRNPDELAKEIAEHFEQNRTRLVIPNKMWILHNWKKTRSALALHRDNPQYSDDELAHLVLHSYQAAYYYNEGDEFRELVAAVETDSEQLALACRFIKKTGLLFERTQDLCAPLKFEDFTELAEDFRPRTDRLTDRDFADWLNILSNDKLELCYEFFAKNEDLDESDRVELWQQAAAAAKQTMALIERRCEEEPKDRDYAELYQSYLNRNLFLLSRNLGESDAARGYLRESVNCRKRFYEGFEKLFPGDTFLCQKFSQEYNLAQLELAHYSDSVLQKRVLARSAKEKISLWQKEYNRQQALLKKLQAAYEELEREIRPSEEKS